MPKLKNQPPKFSRLKKYAVVYHHGKIHYLGLYGTPEALTAYNRFCAEIQGNPTTYLQKEEGNTTVGELAAAFLDHAKATLAAPNYTHHRIVVGDFLLKLYGDTPADKFKPSCLKLIREAMIQSRRFCRKQINEYTRRIVTLFKWGVSVGLVNRMVAWELSLVLPLEPGYPGTFDHPEREYVQDWVIIATLPFLPPVLQAMIKLQRLIAMRPSEVFKMRVGDIDRTSVPGIWLYRLPSHKTQKKTSKKRVIPLNPAEQALIAPYLEGKKETDSVFSPRTAMLERKPGMKVRDKVGDFYKKDSYRTAVLRAVARANRQLPVDQRIPEWTPYELRHSGASAISIELGGDAAQLTLGHTSPTTTAIYLHREIEKLTKLAVERMNHNPF